MGDAGPSGAAERRRLQGARLGHRDQPARAAGRRRARPRVMLEKKKPKKNKAVLIADVPNPGTLVATGTKKLLKPFSDEPAEEGSVKIAMKATKKAKRKLKRKPKLKSKVTVAYTPLGGTTVDATVTAKLKKK